MGVGSVGVFLERVILVGGVDDPAWSWVAINRDTRSFCDGIYLRVGFCRSKQKVKNAKSKGCGATFLKLSAFVF